MRSDRFTYWWNRMWCRIDGHQWMPLHGYLYLCIRDGCRAEKNLRRPDPVDPEVAVRLMADRLARSMTTHRQGRRRCVACQESWPCQTSLRKDADL